MLLPLRRLAVLSCLVLTMHVPADEALHLRIDRLLITAARGKPVSPPADDGEFLRRVSLDLAGTLPTAEAARAFLASADPAKRRKAIDALLAGADYPRRMAERFHLMLMERLGDHPAWSAYLHEAFRRNRPWDVLARELLRAAPDGEGPAGAAFFVAKRLENYGQNPVDYPALARDVGRLFLGKDLRCAQCHDHLFIKEYKQGDFQGLFTFVQNAYLADPAKMLVAEKPLAGKTEFVSVLTQEGKATGPRLPGRGEVAVPTFDKGKEYVTPPDRKTRRPGVPRFSPLTELAREVPASPDFARNAVNRVWALLLGRGLVHPLDLHHAGNPPSHPELLDLLAREFIAHKYDLKWLMREVVLTDAYQRSSRLPEGVTKLDPTRFLTALEKPLTAEQLLWATLQATGERDPVAAASATGGKTTPLEQARAKFVKAFAGTVREPEDELDPSLKGALFLLNDPLLLSWLTPRGGNLIDRLSKTGDDGVASELYLSVLTRQPAAEESAAVVAFLHGKTGERRTRALAHLAWALLASTEFLVNH